MIMNNEDAKLAVIAWFVFGSILFILGVYAFVENARLDAENDYLRQQVKDQKVIIKELKEGE